MSQQPFGIFLSYRREDTAGYAGRLHESLVSHFGPAAVFIDIESIEPGADFIETITDTLARCVVLLALIGPRWLDATAPEGGRRLDDPNDFVRVELQGALDQGLRVIPVLVGGVRMPSEAALPGPLAALSRRQSFELNDRLWTESLTRLIATLDIDPAGARASTEPARVRTLPRSGPAATRVLPPSIATVEQFPFVGRGDELGVLDIAFRQVEDGARRLVLIGGEPGIGKTRLATEMARTAHREGAIVLYGRCDEDLGVPYQPFVECLRHFVHTGAETDLGQQLGPYGGELVRLVPDIAMSVANLAPPLSSDPETERYRLFDAVAAWLGAASQRNPMLLLIDDLQWATKATLLLLRHVVRWSEPMRLLIIATYRDTDLDRSHPLGDVLADLRRDTNVARLSLSGLGPAQVAEFLEAGSGQALGAEESELATTLATETEGNPFFVVETVRHLVESGAIRPKQRRGTLANAVGRLGIAEGVRDVIGRRLAHISTATNDVLRTASAVGLEFSPTIVAASIPLADDSVLDALDEAIASRLVAEVTNGLVHCRFAHALVRATLYDEITAARRVGLHLRIGEAIEATHAGDLDEHLAALAYHFGQAAAAGDATKAIDYATRAGDRALVQLAHTDAVAYYTEALGLLERSGPRPEAGRQCDLRIALGEAQRRAGEPAYRQTLLDAASTARELGDADRLARAALANLRGAYAMPLGGQIDGERIEVFQAALDISDPGDSPARARLLAALATLQLFTASWRSREAISDRAVAMARRLNDPATLADVLLHRYVALWHARSLHHRLDLAAEAAGIADRMGDPFLAVWARMLQRNAEIESGDFDAADEHLEVAAHLADRLGQPFLQWWTAAYQATRLVMTGRLDEGEARAGEAFQLGQAAGEPDALVVFQSQFFEIRYLQGRLAELAPLAADAAALNPGLPALAAAAAMACCETDRHDEARVILERLATDDFAAITDDQNWIIGLGICAQVCARLRDRAAATSLYRLLFPYASQFATNGSNWLGSVARAVGLVASVLERWDEADTQFAVAAAAEERLGARPWLANTQLAWAEMLLDRSDPDDSGRAGDLLNQALVTAQTLGLGAVERRAKQLLAELA